MAARRTNGERLRQYREAKRVSQHELALRAGLAHRAAISKRETGRVQIDRAELFRLVALIEEIAAERVGPSLSEVLGE